MLLNPYRFGVASGDPYWSDVAVLLHFEGTDGSTTFTDQKGKTWTAASPAQIDTGRSKFGSASGLFDGSSAMISTPSSADLIFYAGDFTIEAWVYIDGNSPTDADGSRGASIVNTWNGGSGTANIIGYILSIDGDASTTGTGIRFATWDGSLNMTAYSAAVSVSHDAWHHIAVTVSSGTRRLFLDGVELSGSTSTLGSGYTDASTFGLSVKVGKTPHTDYPLPLNGSIDELRITKGVARYTSGFTVPASAFPDI